RKLVFQSTMRYLLVRGTKAFACAFYVCKNRENQMNYKQWCPCVPIAASCAVLLGMSAVHAASAQCDSPGWLPGDKPAGAGVPSAAACAGLLGPGAVHAAPAQGDAAGWLPGDRPAGAGVNSEYPHVCTEWDPDGPGGNPSRLVVAGPFYSAGGRLANSIAYWD